MRVDPNEFPPAVSQAQNRRWWTEWIHYREKYQFYNDLNYTAINGECKPAQAQ